MSITVRCPIAESFSKHPDAPCIRTEHGSLTYGQLEQQVRFFVQKFRSLGVEKGDRVGIVSENNPLVVSVLFALQRIQASGLFLSLHLAPSDWSSQLSMAQVRILVGQDIYLDKLSDRPETLLSFSGLESEIDIHERIESSETVDLVLDSESSIIFTSSTTGHKKGVVLKVGNFTSSATASNQLTGLSPGDWWGVSLPLYHAGGLGIIFRTLFAGAGSNFLSDFSPPSILSELSRGNLTHLSLVPTVLDALITEAENAAEEGPGNLRLMKACILAGAASSKTLLDRVIACDLPVLGAWGMTETTAHCTCMSLEDPREKISTVGKPFYHTSIKLVNEQGDEVSEEGEILVKGPTVCSGYLDPSGSTSRIVDDWLYTGDLGSFDGEGYLKITGRKDDMFISGGENIHAGEIESVIKTFWKVRDVAVIPVSHPKWGHRPVIIAETRDGSSLDIKEVRDFLSDKIAKIKIPDKAFHVSALPRTAIGKIDYKELRKRYS